MNACISILVVFLSVNISSQVSGWVWQNPLPQGNSITAKNYDLPKTGYVELIIYDINGREITKLVNQQMNAGSYSTDWDASNYPSGVYLLVLRSQNFLSSKKMILLK